MSKTAGRVPASASAVLWCAWRGQSGCPQPGGCSGGLQGSHPEPAGFANILQADGTGGWEDTPEAKSGHHQGQPEGAAGQAGPGGGWGHYGGEKKKLAACRGEEDEDAEGGGLAGGHNCPGAGQEGKVLGLLGRKHKTAKQDWTVKIKLIAIMFFGTEYLSASLYL